MGWYRGLVPQWAGVAGWLPRATRETQQQPGLGAGGVRSAGEAAEHQAAVAAMSCLAEAAKQRRTGADREAGPQGGKGEGGRRAKLTLRASP